jgi:hypothetical protein
MSITIHPELEAILRVRAEAEGLTVEAYIERIARDDDAAEEELEALALDGIKSGESIVADEKYWEDKRRLLRERHQKMSTPHNQIWVGTRALDIPPSRPCESFL